MDQLEIELEKFENISADDLMDMMSGIDFDNGDQYSVDDVESNVCINCNKPNTLFEDYSNGILVCKECGQVNENVIDANPEWRNYDGTSNKARCSSITNPLLPRSSLGTSIRGYTRSKVKNLHEWDAMPYEERSLNIVLKEIRNRCQKNNILKCIEDDAKIMYKWVSECKHKEGKNKGRKYIIRGANRLGLIGACLFFACRKNGQTHSPKEIAKIFDLKFTDATKGLKTFMKLIKLRSDIKIGLGKSSSDDFVPRFCRELSLKKTYINQAIKIARNTDELNIASKHTPISIAAGSIMLMIEMAGLTITKKALSEKFDVSEVTISKAYKSIEQYREILVDDEKTQMILTKIKKDREKNELPEHLKKRYEENLNKNKSTIIDDEESYCTIKSDDSFANSIADPCKLYEDIEYYKNIIDMELYDTIAYTEEEYKVVSTL
ncbi:MAG: hypothetical protein CMF62_01505 [Magnetococcales bacterium]|nr:hypothetical protein [Magnetococcales bacterium]|tara:strand:- start:31155 stop:32462 length:1308 start_codon:yes stop_codon:yes gene_type:complete